MISPSSCPAFSSNYVRASSWRHVMLPEVPATQATRRICSTGPWMATPTAVAACSGSIPR